MFETWVSTVWRDSNSSAAMSGLDWRTRRCRSQRLPHTHTAPPPHRPAPPPPPHRAPPPPPPPPPPPHPPRLPAPLPPPHQHSPAPPPDHPRQQVFQHGQLPSPANKEITSHVTE